MRVNKRPVIVGSLLLAAVWGIWCIFWLPKGLDFSHVGLYCSQAWRLAQGDLPFLDEIVCATSLSPWWLSFVFRIHPACSFLELRIIWAIAMLLCALVTAYLMLRYFNPVVSFTGAAASLFFVTGGAYQFYLYKVLSYNTMPYLPLLLTVWLWLAAYHRRGRSQLFLAAGAGIAAFLATTCRFSLVVVILLPILTLVYDRFCRIETDGLRRAAITFLIVYLAGVLCFFLALGSTGLIDDFFNAWVINTVGGRYGLGQIASRGIGSGLLILLPAVVIVLIVTCFKYRESLMAFLVKCRNNSMAFLAKYGENLTAFLKKHKEASAFIFAGGALVFLTASVVLSPSFVATHFSPDHLLEPATIHRVQLVRGIAGLLGIFSGLVSLFTWKPGWRALAFRPFGYFVPRDGERRRQLSTAKTQMLPILLAIILIACLVFLANLLWSFLRNTEVFQYVILMVTKLVEDPILVRRVAFLLFLLAISFILVEVMLNLFNRASNPRTGRDVSIIHDRCQLGIMAIFLSLIMILGTVGPLNHASFKGAWLPISMAVGLAWFWPVGWSKRVTRSHFTWLLRGVGLVLLLLFSCFGILQDYHPSLWQFNTSPNTVRLQGILTTPERADYIDSLIRAVERYSKPGDRILVYYRMSMLYYLTDRLPATYHLNPAVKTNEVRQLMLEDMIERGRVPKLIVYTDPPSPSYARDDPIDEYVKEHYEVVEEIDEYMKEPSEVIRDRAYKARIMLPKDTIIDNNQ